MSNVLCWELKQNGRYCKNYRLKNKNKCNMHYEYNQTFLQLLFILSLVSITVYTTLYLDVDVNLYMKNVDLYMKNIDINLHVDNICKYIQTMFIQMYKIDKELIVVYFKMILYYTKAYTTVYYQYLKSYL